MIAWLQLEVAAKVTLSVAYLCIALVVLLPPLRLHELLENKLASALMVIFLSCGVGYGLDAWHLMLVNDTRSALQGAASNTWTGTWHALSAAAAVFYLTLRRQHGRLLLAPKVFYDLGQHQQLVELDALRTESDARAEAEAARDYYAAMLHSINQSSQDLIYVKDLEDRYLMINGAFERMFEITQARLLGHTDEMLDPIHYKTWQSADHRARQGPYQVEEFIEVTDGRHYFASTKFPLFDANGVLYAICGVSKDVTEQKKFTGAIAQARDEALAANEALAGARDAALAAVAAKSTFLATMSHEIRTPMNAVIGMTDLLADTELDATQLELVHTVRNSGDALLAVINSILDFSKIESGELHLASAPFDVRDEIESCVDLVSVVASAKNLDLVCHVDDSCPAMVDGDADRMRQIVINILSNAVKFTSVGDVLITVQAESSGGRWLLTIEVADTGIGISEAGVLRLFKSFSQVDDAISRTYEGTGLGLVISQRLARAMGGDVTVTSTVGEGSCFAVTLRLDSSAQELPDAPSLTSNIPLAGVSVLIVDDNATTRRILDLQLSGLQMLCTTAGSSAAALALASEGHHYDLAVVDLRMPDMDGQELSAALHRQPAMATTPVVLLTSMGLRPPDTDGEFAVLLAKPVKPDALRAAVLSALSHPAPPDGSRRPQISPTTQPLKILLAEDNLVNQRVAQLMLDKLGHAVDIVDNGRAAVDAVMTVPYDVVLMDVQMPYMDGVEATRRIRARLPATAQPHIIAMTASTMVEDRVTCAAVGMESYLTKPVRIHELQTMLGRVCATIRPPGTTSVDNGLGDPGMSLGGVSTR